MKVSGTGSTWRDEANCLGAEDLLFFPPPCEKPHDKLAREARAKAICGECTVRAECLDFALKSREKHGIWGGLNEAERQELM